MSKHTPGPWTTSGTTVFTETRKDGPAVASCGSFADAHLIAAAPDLLVALRDLLTATETAEDTHEDWQGYIRAKERARAAIAKAEGRTA